MTADRTQNAPDLPACGAALPDPIAKTLIHVCSRVDDHSRSPKGHHWDHLTGMTWPVATAASGWKARSEAQERELREAAALLRDFADYIEDSEAIVNGGDVAAAIRLVTAQAVPDGT